MSKEENDLIYDQAIDSLKDTWGSSYYANKNRLVCRLYDTGMSKPEIARRLNIDWTLRYDRLIEKNQSKLRWERRIKSPPAIAVTRKTDLEPLTRKLAREADEAAYNLWYEREEVD